MAPNELYRPTVCKHVLSIVHVKFEDLFVASPLLQTRGQCPLVYNEGLATKRSSNLT